MVMPANPRIWATLDVFVEGGEVWGRKMANRDFLKALLQADPYDSYHFLLSNEDYVPRCRAFLADNYPAMQRRGAFEVASYVVLPERLASNVYHCFHLASPAAQVAPLAAMRNAVAANLFPITAVTHSLNYVGLMADFFRTLWSGVCPRDALIVTSHCARLVMERIYASLRAGYGLDAAAFPAPELALLPLGVDADLLPGEDERPGRARGQAARRMRERLKVGGRVMILCLARFNPASKMEVLPLLAALRRALQAGLQREAPVLVLAGWADEDDQLPEALCSYGRSLGLEVRLLLRPTDAERRALYAAADIFVSPSDNIQETFGLTVAEAQLSGLPVVASDFDGYRDIVLHEESGFLIPTLGARDTALTEIRSLFWKESQYHLALGQQTVVDVPALADALYKLASDPALRQRMSRAARQRGRLFSWQAVIPRWCALWDELAARPLEPAREEALRESRHPQTMYFADFFAGHFTNILDADYLARLRVRRTAMGEALYRGALPTHAYKGLEYLLDEKLLRRLLYLSRQPINGAELLRALEETAQKAEAAGESTGKLAAGLIREKAAFTLLWALKQDYLETLSGV